MWKLGFTVMLCALFSFVQTDPGGDQGTDVTAGPLELGVAVVVDGRTLEVRRFVERIGTRTIASRLPPGVKAEIRQGTMELSPSSEVVRVVETQSTRVDTATITVRRIDGRAVPVKTLMAELVKPTPVILLKTDQQVDPLFQELFKPEALVLVMQVPGTPASVFPR